MHRTNRVPRGPVGGLLLLGLLFGGGAYSVWGQPAPAPAPAPAAAPAADKDGAKSGPVFVPVGGAVRVQMKNMPNGKPPLIVSVVNDKESIVRINAVGGIGSETGDPTTIILTGLTPGTAHLKLKSKADLSTKPPYLEQTEDFEIVVELDIEILRRLLKKAVPTAAVEPIPGAGNTIILTGTVAHSEDITTVMGIAASLTAGGAGPAQIINAMRVGGVMQVQLDVVVALVEREQMRKMSIDFYDAGQHHDFTSVPGGSFNLPSPGTGLSGQIPPVTQPFTIQNLTASPNNAPISNFLNVFNSRQAFFAFIQALRTNNLAKILAEPHLVTMSGKPANFVSGGEQVVPSISGFGGVAGVTFVPFGTTIQFLPIVLGNGKIYMEVQPEVSQLSAAAGAVIGAGFIDGRTVQRVRSTVMMEDGQTMAIGGLIQNIVQGTITKIPVLGDMPFIGPFFSSKSFDETETELVIMVTPHLVDPMDCCQVPKYLPGQETRTPDDFELFLENILEAPRGSREVNHDGRYVPAWKNGPTAKQYPCVSSSNGPPLGCPGCPDSMAPGVGVPIPHDILQQPGPVAPLQGNVVVEGEAAPAQGVQPAGATAVEAAPAGAAGTAPAPTGTEQPANLPPVSSVPLTAGSR